jgi:hypothetical protein
MNEKLNKHLKIHKTFINQTFKTQISSLDQTLHPSYQQKSCKIANKEA